MESVVQDIRAGWRRLARAPGFALVAIATLALSIGANAAVFSAVSAAWLRPLPLSDGQRLWFAWTDNVRYGFTRLNVSPSDFLAWQAGVRSFTALAAYTQAGVNLSGPTGEPVRLPGLRATAGLMRALGIRPLLGREIAPEEDRRGGPCAALVGRRLWVTRFGSDPQLVGSRLTLDGEDCRVAGVLPDGLERLFGPADVWLPLRLDPADGDHKVRYLEVLARLRDGHTRTQAEAELHALMAALAQAAPSDNAGYDAHLEPLREALYPARFRQALLLLQAAVGFVLLLGCANLAHLLLARVAEREHELALRHALGASRARLFREALAEHLLLTLAGAAAGALLAVWGGNALAAALESELSARLEPALDARVLACVAALAVGIAAAFAALASRRAAGTAPAASLRDAGRATTALRGRRVLLGLEAALALLLLVGAGLALGGFRALSRVEPGFDARHALTASVSLAGPAYADEAARTAFYERLLERLREQPGVEQAAAVDTLPMGGVNAWSTLRPEDAPPPSPEQAPRSGDLTVTPGYFRAMGIPLLRGREFDARDGLDAPPVAVVNRTLAAWLWPGQDALGRRFRRRRSGDTPLVTIVGVVGDVRHEGRRRELRPEMYAPLAQRPQSEMTLVVRTVADPAAVAEPLRRAVRAVDPTQPLSEVRTMQAVLARDGAAAAVLGWLLGLFAVLALLLAALGAYGVVAHTLARSRRELSLRLALGAQPGDLTRFVLRVGLQPAALGTLAGLAASLALRPVLGSLVFGLGELDPRVPAGAGLLLLGAALGACLPAARAAARVDPIAGLRVE